MSSFNPSRRSLIAGLSTAALVTPIRAEPVPTVLVTKGPNCSCCNAWAEHLRQAGFEVKVIDGPVAPLKAKLGVPRDLASCHTAQIGGYVVEGHVPASAMKELLARKPDATGIAVPGMPVGSPGMEVERLDPEVYEVVQFGKTGRETLGRFRGTMRV